MKREAHKDRIAEFRSDRNLLDYSDTRIAARMGMDKGNYSKYINGHQRITRYFLTLFYQAFGDELSAIKLATEKAKPTVEEKLEEIAQRLDHLQQICERLAEKNL
jgi:transcriptional regulator with XRE-family HTH domain